MEDQSDGNERQAGQLRADLAAEREALLAVVSGVDEHALTWATRNPGWTVRDVLAHLLAADADLVSLLEAAARPSTHPLQPPTGPQEHQQEMARWTDATREAFVGQLRERGDRWLALLAALPGPAFAMPVTVEGAARPLGEVIGYWRGHDREHAEDVRLALAGDPAGESP